MLMEQEKINGSGTELQPQVAWRRQAQSNTQAHWLIKLQHLPTTKQYLIFTDDIFNLSQWSDFCVFLLYYYYLSFLFGLGLGSNSSFYRKMSQLFFTGDDTLNKWKITFENFWFIYFLIFTLSLIFLYPLKHKCNRTKWGEGHKKKREKKWSWSLKSTLFNGCWRFSRIINTHIKTVKEGLKDGHWVA